MSDPAARATSAIVARALAYEFLAQLFAYPDEPRLQAIHERASEVADAGVRGEFARIAAVALHYRRETLEPVFVELTTLSSSPDCPAFETGHSGGDPQHQTQRMADIAGFYRAFGVDATSGGFRPDDISVELDFMGFLCRKEAFAQEHLGPPRARQARKAQRLFLEEHLGRWAPAFGDAFAAAAPRGHLYELAGRTLTWWIALECAAARVAPLPFPAQARAQWPAPVSHGPEFAGDSGFIPLEAMTVR